jgi:hypothetical protein
LDAPLLGFFFTLDDRPKRQSGVHCLGNSSALFLERRLHMTDVDFTEVYSILDRNCRCHSGALTGHCAAHHVPNRGMGDFVPGNTSSGNQKVANFPGKKSAEWDLVVASRRG